MQSYGTDNQGAAARGEWLPSRTWQAKASQKMAQEAAARQLREAEQANRRRKIRLTLYVAGIIAIVSPISLWTQVSFADSADNPVQFYDTQHEATSRLGERLATASATDKDSYMVNSSGVIVSDEMTMEDIENLMGTAGEDGVSQGTPSKDTSTGQPAEPNPETPPTAPEEASQIELPAEIPAEPAPAPEQGAFAPVDNTSVPIDQGQPSTVSADPAVPEWWSVPSWNSTSAPQYDALGVWDVHYYIAHNWTSYGEKILAMKPGDMVSVDGQLLIAKDVAIFAAGTDYEVVRQKFGWDAWCLQTCYGDNHVRVVSCSPINFA